MHPNVDTELRNASGNEARLQRRWLRTPEAAAYTGHGKSTLDKLRLTGGGPPFVKRGTAVVYDRDDLDRWMEERKVRSTSQRPAADPIRRVAPTTTSA